MKLTRVSLFVAATSVSLGFANFGAQAQEAPQAPDGVRTTSYKVIRIRNVSPGLIAFWLDPKGHPFPTQLSVPGMVAPKANEAGFQLPEGVTLINPIEAQNSLLVLGTPEGIKNVEETVQFLDRPLKQVEIECQFARIKEDGLEDFGLVPPDKNKPKMSLGFVRGNFRQKLAAAIQAHRLELISAPRICIINNLTVPIFAAKDLNEDKSELRVTPTINNDDTITLFFGEKLGRSQNEMIDGKAVTGPGYLNVIANVRDGETIGITQFHPDFLPNFEAKSLAPGEKLVLFTTPRIIRRAGDVETLTTNLTR